MNKTTTYLYAVQPNTNVNIPFTTSRSSCIEKTDKTKREHLGLKEIIWEVCGACNIRCSYCGSKECWNDKIDEKKIRKIADAIALYPPEQIDISGGNPMLVSYGTHKYIVSKLKKTKCKVLINAKVLNDSVDNYLTCLDNMNKLDLYSWIGLSINTKDEINSFRSTTFNKKVEFLKGKVTVITNFNADNLDLFNDIYAVVKDLGCLWQIQFTVYKGNSKKAIYLNEELLSRFDSYLSNTFDPNIILADNMNSSNCAAGKHSIGILNNGDVIPCLSMRSWLDVKEVVEGNILKKSLKSIWESGFGKYRFSDFKCCKDHCKNRVFSTFRLAPYFPQPFENYPTIDAPQIILYGVSPNTTVVYAVGTNPVVTFYAVSTTPNPIYNESDTYIVSDDTVYEYGVVDGYPNVDVYAAVDLPSWEKTANQIKEALKKKKEKK
ncbi:MAG: SPASM domain-containing protein [Candidatus Paceibacterota bacterium]|jgi:MoaA/NifB/PqqE/SkfB family radical SAM enzyme